MKCSMILRGLFGSKNYGKFPILDKHMIVSRIIHQREDQVQSTRMCPSSLQSVQNILFSCCYQLLLQCYSKLKCATVITSEAAHCIQKIFGILTDVNLHSLSKFHQFPGN